MNMKRIVFVGVGILAMLIIIGWMLYSIAHVDEINQQRREKDQGEALASRMITTTATTSIWDALRQTETSVGGANGTVPENQSAPNESIPDESVSDETVPDEETQEEFAEDISDNLSEEAAPIPQTITETSEDQAVIPQ